jgi:hypothetical protein
MNEYLAVRKAYRGCYFLMYDGHDVCGNVHAPYSSNTAEKNVTDYMCSINKSLEKCNIAFALKMVIAATTNCWDSFNIRCNCSPKAKLPILSNMHLEGLTNAGSQHYQDKNSSHEIFPHKIHTAYPHYCILPYYYLAL